jgi:Carboxypeptidase regulatory-like domain/TonB dependent receptor-like, beta-barrel
MSIRGTSTRFLFPIVFVWLALASIASAQLGEGTIVGSVTDATGAPLPSATITVRNIGTNLTRTTTTDDHGLYRISNLAAGRYEIKAEMAAFTTKIVSPVTVDVGQTSRYDFSLTVGERKDTVVVSGQAPIIDVEQGRLSSIIEEQQITDLPLLNRSTYGLVSLQPGAMLMPGGVFSVRLTAPPMTSVNGNRFRGNNYVLDGSTVTNMFFAGEPSITPPPDAVQEFEIQTSNFAPEYGRGNAATINIQTKSGTNQFHGNAYDSIQNAFLNARNYFVPRQIPLVSNQFGFTFGGPLIKDKFFFFTSYEGHRRSLGRAEQDTVETPEFRQLVITNAPNSIAAQLYQQYPAQTPLPGSEVTIGALAQALGPLGPPANSYFAANPSVPAIGTAESVVVDHQKTDEFLIRADYDLSANTRLFARWIGSYESSDGGWNFLNGISRAARGFRSPFNGFFGNMELGLNNVITLKAVNEFRFSFQRNRSDYPAPHSEVPDIENVLIGGVAGFGANLFAPDAFAINSLEFRDIVSVDEPRHGMKFGAELRRIQDNSNHCQFCRPGFFFLTLFDFAQDFPLFEDALVNPDTGEPTGTPREFRRLEFGAFAQDNWRVTSRLTFNLGVRYDLFTVLTEKHGVLGNIILGSGSTFIDQLAGASVGRVNHLYDGNHLNFSPRMGLAWDPTGSGKTSLRAGYGITYAPNGELFTSNARFNAPDNVVGVAYFPTNYGLPPTVEAAFTGGLNQSGSFNSGARTRPWVVSPHLPTQYSEDWFASVQRSLGHEISLELSYVGTAGKHEEFYYDPNRVRNSPRPNPNFDNIVLVEDSASSIYHGMTVDVKKRFTAGFSLQANYRWSKYIADFDDSSPFDILDNPVGAGVMQDPANRRAERALSIYDVPHRFSLNTVWDTPFFKKNQGFTEKVLGGWQLSGIVTLQSGRPFTVFNSAVDYNNDGGGNPIFGTPYDRPDVPAFGTNLSGWSRSRYLTGVFQASDFPTPAPGTDGTLGRNTYRGPGLAQVNTSVAKTFHLSKGELPNLQFRGDIFNLFNRVNLYQPVSDLSNPLFGKSTQAYDPRQFQLALKLYF